MPRLQRWRIANIRARPYVQARREFNGSHLYGRWRGAAYVVYSYGPHFPLYVWRDGQWYGNEDHYSSTTAKHKTQVMPLGYYIEWRSTAALQQLLQVRVVTGLFGEPLTGVAI